MDTLHETSLSGLAVTAFLGAVVLVAVLNRALFATSKRTHSKTSKTKPKMSAQDFEGKSAEELLVLARGCANRGEEGLALDAIVRAIREKCGDGNVMSMLDTAKQFAQSDAGKLTTPATEGKTQREILSSAVSGEGSILSEEYDEDDVAEALKKTVKSGESRVCTRCGDVVATTRLEAHSTMWCSALPDSEEED